MQAKEFQKDAIETVDKYLGVLREELTKWISAQEVAKQHPDLEIKAPDFTETTWRRLLEDGTISSNRPFSPRKTTNGDPVPNFTLKVPTGGGKTYLGVRTIERILDRYLDPKGEKLVLWIVPSEAIYAQTKGALMNRESALRKLLDAASGNRVQILEKDSPINRADLKANLTVLLLMLPSANRQDAVNKLKMFQDRGNVNGFLPDEDDRPAHEALKSATPNLHTVDIDSVFAGEAQSEKQVGLVRASLGNALRLVRPVVVLDEGHKGFKALSHQTIYGLNPCIVVELTATPKDEDRPGADGTRRTANILVNISGTQLSDEEMIKQPLVGKVSADSEPYSALGEAWQKIEDLQLDAETYLANGGPYIRPILLVQVERVSADFIGGDAVHAEHVKQWFLNRGVHESAIKIKTSQQNDLAEYPPGDLMKPDNPTRVIITKSALQEGWDCPFAYVLCALAANRNASALTQLIGRILRQPYVTRTGVQSLDQCYVYTNRVETKIVTDAVQEGLEEAGMGDLIAHISDGNTRETTTVDRLRRAEFEHRNYYLPEVMVHEDGDKLRHLDWEADILGLLDWENLQIELYKGDVTTAKAETYGLVFKKTVDDLPWSRVDTVEAGKVVREFDVEFAIRNLLDEIPNAWVAYDVLTKYLQFLRDDGWTEDQLGGQQAYVLNCLTSRIRKAIDKAAKKIFEDGLDSNRIVFRLSPVSGWPLPHKELISISPGARKLRNNLDEDLKHSLMVPLFQKEFNNLETPVAVFLDEQEAVTWWYRNAVRGSAYGLQGWRRKRVYPDFIIAKERNDQVDQWLVIETKGDQLAGNLDTTYKGELLGTLAKTSERQAGVKIGQLTLFEKVASYEAAVVVESTWQEEISKLLNDDSDS
ncbi:MAG: DEAD/DEAH box helicase family protein [Fimbriimonadaceae bacterium]|nr:DEAD/DEAH box helicase family protein [Fimbriimonadaceae bacterium]